MYALPYYQTTLLPSVGRLSRAAPDVHVRQDREPGPRRILADFLIGAHALLSARHLLTLGDRFYKAAFPGLTITVP
jgi:predicted nucleic acid-binding protein